MTHSLTTRCRADRAVSYTQRFGGASSATRGGRASSPSPVRYAVRKGGTKREIMARAEARGAGKLLLAAVGACVDEALRVFA